MIQINCDYDENGFRRASISAPHEKVAWYLEQDIQGSIQCCDLMLDVCQKIEEESLQEWCGTGNAHTVTIKKALVFIENEYADTEVECSLSDFRVALATWKNFLTKEIEK